MLSQHLYNIEDVLILPRSAFVPKPKVRTAVLKFNPKDPQATKHGKLRTLSSYFWHLPTGHRLIQEHTDREFFKLLELASARVFTQSNKSVHGIVKRWIKQRKSSVVMGDSDLKLVLANLGILPTHRPMDLSNDIICRLTKYLAAINAIDADRP